ncbi:Hypothetical predicted protein [Olea europaea subsp. europaea]|uniref:Uncharacterized protein n=1 Tax=Olea europaea subsp. europaea TaxID=158383 RepID=A0A8S0P7E6_OLEEU|nr:Hypothetical predicted protein [Olea europaea subsp. europaea]
MPIRPSGETQIVNIQWVWRRKNIWLGGFISRPAVMVVVTTQMGSEPPSNLDGNTDLTKSVQQGRSFLEVARLGGGNVMKSPPIPMKNPTLINGLLGFSFTDQETKKLADDLKFALVLKFLVTRPNIDDLR